MIFKIIFLLIFSTNIFAWVRPEVFHSKYLNLEDSLLKRTIDNQFSNATSALEEKTVDFILADQNKLINQDFKINNYFQSSVRFWFSIYTQFTSKQVVIHDKTNLDIVYNIIDFTEIHNSDINKYAKAKLQSQLSLEYTRKLKKILKKFANNINNLSDEEKGILAAVKRSHKIPKNKKKRVLFFKELASNVRTQTGQRDMIYRGVLRAMPYFDYLYLNIEKFKLPKELVAISFLESSFNPHAYSKVGAAGAWQFMPYIAGLFMPKRSSVLDYRLNPIISSLAAFHLLKQNKMILKRWDLAVTAYNSGTKHLIKAKRKFTKIKELSLEYVLENYDHDHLGFASKNFYSEFLALVHVLAYRDVIFPLQGFKENFKRFKMNKLEVYISKCTVKPSKIFKLLQKSSPNLQELNTHFMKPTKTFKRGSLVVSDLSLTQRKYYKLSDKQIVSQYPKNWHKFIKNKRCGKL